MRKNLAVIFTVILFCIFLSGCSIKRVSAVRTNDYLVSAVGFEERGNKITVFAEAVIINTEDLSAEKKVELLEGTGGTIEEAFADLHKKSVEVLEFSHCAVSVMGEDLSSQTFSNINKYLLKLEKLNISVQLVSCSDVKALLSCEPKTSVAIGYDIVSLLKKESFITGIKYKNRLYETALERHKSLDVVAIPSIKVTSGEYYTQGLAILKQGTVTLKLNKEQSAVYAIATDTQGKGEFILNSKKYSIESNVTTVNISKEDPNTVIFTLELKANGEKEKIKRAIAELFNISKTAKTDVFGIGKRHCSSL